VRNREFESCFLQQKGGLGWYMVESGLADRVEVS
jgi:hypothetical protein